MYGSFQKVKYKGFFNGLKRIEEAQYQTRTGSHPAALGTFSPKN